VREKLKKALSHALNELQRALRRVRCWPPLRWLARSPVWRNDIFRNVVATLIALTIAGVLGPAQLTKDFFGSIADVFQADPTAESREVSELYARVLHSRSWEVPPTPSLPGRFYLEDHWSALRPDQVHTFPYRAATWRTLDELFHDTSLDGHPLLISGYVDQTYDLAPADGSENLIEQGFRLRRSDEEAVAWCGPTAFERGSQPFVDQLVEIKGIVVARGSKSTQEGGFVSGSYLVCSAVKALASATAAKGVAALFRSVEGDTYWSRPPSMSASGRIYLLYHWEEASPFRPHRFPDRYLRPVPLNHVLNDTRFDDREVRVSGFVTQHGTFPSYRGTVRESLRLGVGGEDASVWCETTLQDDRIIEDGEFVEAVGVPVARGIAPLSAGGFQGITVMACPALRVR
jgi:hypothetical protein